MHLSNSHYITSNYFATQSRFDFFINERIGRKGQRVEKADMIEIEDAAFLAAMEASLATGLADTDKVLSKIKKKSK